MIIGLHHVGRAVVDIDAVSSQLEALTSWTIAPLPSDDPLLAGLDCRGGVSATGPNGSIELVAVGGTATGPRGVHVAGVTHAAVQVPRIDVAVERIDAAGMTRHADPVALGTGYLYLYVRDADGSVTEIEGVAPAPDHLDPWLAHGAIATPDLDRLRRSYEALLGNPATRTDRIRSFPPADEVTGLADVDTTATWVPAGNVVVEIWQYDHPPTEPVAAVELTDPGVGHLAFESDDLPVDISLAADAGFELRHPPTSSAGATVARLTDPDGNWIELLHFADHADHRSLRVAPDVDRAARMNALVRSARPTGGGAE